MDRLWCRPLVLFHGIGSLPNSGKIVRAGLCTRLNETVPSLVHSQYLLLLYLIWIKYREH